MEGHGLEGRDFGSGRAGGRTGEANTGTGKKRKQVQARPKAG
jgi:hypothetical protein